MIWSGNMLDCQEKEKKLLAEHLDCTESIWEPESAIRNMLAHLSRRQGFFVEGDTWKGTITRPASLWGCHTMHVKFGFFSIGFSIKHHLIMCFTSHFLKKDSILSNHDVIKPQCFPFPFFAYRVAYRGKDQQWAPGHGGHGSHCGTERCHGTVFGRTVHHWKPESFHWWLCQAGPQGGKSWSLQGFSFLLFLPFFGLTWIFHMMEKKSKGFLAKCIRIYIMTILGDS